MDRKIDSEEQLKSFLARSYWLETKMEQTKEWIAFLEVKSDKAKDVLFQIIRDSDYHKEMLKKLFSKIKGFNLHRTLADLDLDEEKTIFKNKWMRRYFRRFMLQKKRYLKFLP